MNKTYARKKELLKEIEDIINKFLDWGMSTKELKYFITRLECNGFDDFDFDSVELSSISQVRHFKFVVNIHCSINKIKKYHSCLMTEYKYYNFKYYSIHTIDNSFILNRQDKNLLIDILDNIDLSSKDNYKKSMLDCLETLKECFPNYSIHEGVVRKQIQELIDTISKLIYYHDCKYYLKRTITFNEYQKGVEKYIAYDCPDYETISKQKFYNTYSQLFVKEIKLNRIIEGSQDRVYINNKLYPDIKLCEILNPIKHVNKWLYQDVRKQILDR